MSKQFPFTASPQSVVVFFNGKMRNIPSSDPAFAELYEHLKNPVHDILTVERLVDKGTMLERLTVGEVTVRGNGVYYKGAAIHSSLAEKLLRMLDAGFDASNWARFLSRVMENPSERSRACLFDFLSHWNAPITEDGHFIAFKRVRNDYRDIYTGTMDNSPGQIVSMAREKVNDDPNQTCSYGLHVAATSYLASYASASGHRTIACKIDPVDVVAVPTDYNGAKMRVCSYLVLGDAEETFYNNAEDVHVYNVSATIEKTLSDLKGQPISLDAVTFSKNWQRDINATLSVGTFVAPTAYSGDTLPSNKFIVGVVSKVTVPEEGTDITLNKVYVDVVWQDGSQSEKLRFNVVQPLNSDVVPLVYVGDAQITTPTPSAETSDNAPYLDEDWVPGDDDEDDDWSENDDDDADDESADDDDVSTTYIAATEEPDLDDLNDNPGERTFSKDGVTYTASTIRQGVSEHGQRGFARFTGIPRTTIQEWLKAIG